MKGAIIIYGGVVLCPEGWPSEKDCEDCRHSFLTPDRKAKLCPRCAGKSRKMGQPEKISPKDPPSKTTAAAKAPNGKRSLGPPADQLLVRNSKKVDTLPEIRNSPPKSKDPEEETRKKEPGQGKAKDDRRRDGTPLQDRSSNSEKLGPGSEEGFESGRPLLCGKSLLLLPEKRKILCPDQRTDLPGDGIRSLVGVPVLGYTS